MNYVLLTCAIRDRTENILGIGCFEVQRFKQYMWSEFNKNKKVAWTYPIHLLSF